MGRQAGLSALKKEQSKMREGDAWRQEGVSALCGFRRSSRGRGAERAEGLEESVPGSESSKEAAQPKQSKQGEGQGKFRDGRGPGRTPLGLWLFLWRCGQLPGDSQQKGDMIVSFSFFFFRQIIRYTFFF